MYGRKIRFDKHYEKIQLINFALLHIEDNVNTGLTKTLSVDSDWNQNFLDSILLIHGIILM